ncbi:carbohydrate ABC transporter permease [Xylanivirga thermophila]|uniref:carbohydrate ABC transporter permease n=1 Tax=Xylanivirga thermophila TaxID=2496273 RepID=UPI00101C4CA9|nr:carbohydrate ABC transporter permease [Xylanivirga thermophila]
MDKRKIPLSKILIHVILILGSIIMIIPFFWMISTSLKTFPETMKVPPVVFPKVPQFENYRAVIDTVPFLTYYRNTIIVTVVRTLGQLFFCSLAAFAFAKLKFKGRDFLFFGFLSVLMVPTQMILIPNYIIMKTLRWLDTLAAVIAPGMFSAFGVFLMRQFFMTLPDELIESGKIDGCNYFGIYWKLLLPLTKPALTALAVFTIMYSWNDFLWPLIATTSDEARVLSIGIALLQGQYSTAYHHIMAGSVMATIPILIIFIFAQRYFIEGIALTGMKN